MMVVVNRIALLAVVATVGVGLLAVPASASDKSVAKALVISQKDAGSGYTASKATPNENTYPEIAACVGKPVSKRVVTAHVEGSDLTNDQDGSTISSSVEIVKTPAMAKTDRAVLSDPKFADCLAQIAKSRLAGQGVSDVSSQPVDVKRYGNFSLAIETSVSGTSNGQPLQLSVVQVGILKGRAELMENFITEGTQPFNQDQGQAILDKLNQRLKKAKV